MGGGGGGGLEEIKRNKELLIKFHNIYNIYYYCSLQSTAPRAEFLTLFTITQRDVDVYSTLRLLKSTLRLLKSTLRLPNLTFLN